MLLALGMVNANGNQLPYEANGCARPLPLNAKISMKISTGACKVTPPAAKEVEVPNTLMSSSDFILWASQNNIKINQTTVPATTETGHRAGDCVLLNEDWSNTNAISGDYCAFNGAKLTTGKTYILREYIEDTTGNTGTE